MGFEGFIHARRQNFYKFIKSAAGSFTINNNFIHLQACISFLMKSIFKNIQVIELSTVLAGPAVGMFFAELGARVTKIENKLTGGDITRQWKLPTESKSEKVSAYFASVNYGKKSLFLDFNNEKDKQKLYKLIAEADIVISNYKKGDAEKLGMSYKDIKKIKRDIIYGHISGYGINSKRVAYDIVLQAETGFMSMNGDERSGPLKMPVAVIDMMAAHQMKEAILIAIINRLKTGKGAYIKVSVITQARVAIIDSPSKIFW